MTGALIIRRGRIDDIPALLNIQVAAARRFSPLGLITTADGMPDAIPNQVLVQSAFQGLLLTAEHDQGPVGFALCSIERPDLYLDQISVAPEAGRNGVGAALLSAVSDEAERRGLWGVTLSTFRHVPWNAPFFAKHAFQEVPRSGLALWQLDIERAQAATMDVGARCFMRRPTQHAAEALAA